MKTSNYFLFLIALFTSFCTFGQWKIQNTGTTASFRSLAVVNKNVVWAGGSRGVVLKTTNGGKNWEVLNVKNADSLEFRGIAAFDAKTAWLMSAGEAETGAAKIFKTTDGGLSWKIVFETTEKGVFLDCLKMKNRTSGFVLGDPINGKSYLLRTNDAGESWQRVHNLPDMLPNEASFAASNSNIAIQENSTWIATQSRIFYSENDGKTWTTQQTPFQQGTTSGIFGLHFWNKKEGVAVGGDYIKDKETYNNIAKSTDGGASWDFMSNALPQGLKESAAMLPNSRLLVVGTSGTGMFLLKENKGQLIDNQSFHVVQCAKKTCYAVGAKGNVGKAVF